MKRSFKKLSVQLQRLSRDFQKLSQHHSNISERLEQMFMLIPSIDADPPTPNVPPVFSSASWRINEVQDFIDQEDLIAWLDATVQGTPALWEDQKGAIDGTQSTEADKPAVGDINELAAMHFDGVDDWYDTPAFLIAQEFTLFFVFYRDSTGTIDPLLGGSHYCRLLTTAKIQIGSSQFDIPATVPVGLHVLIITRSDSDQLRLFLDGTEATNSPITDATLYGFTRIGKYSTDFFDGKIGEIGHINRKLADAEIAEFNTLLTDKWSANNLPYKWSDQLGTNDGSAVTGQRATFDLINGRQAMLFDGLDDFYSLGSPLQAVEGPFTLAAVVQRSSAANDDYLLGRSDLSSHVRIKTSGTLRIRLSNQTVVEFALGAGITDLQVIIINRDSDNNTRVWSNGVESSSGTKEVLGAAAFNRVGNSSTLYFTGKIADIIFWDYAHTESAIQTINSSLTDKWSTTPVPAEIPNDWFVAIDNPSRSFHYAVGDPEVHIDQYRPYIHNLGTNYPRHQLKLDTEYEFYFTVNLDANADTWLPYLNKFVSLESQHGWLLLWQLHAVVDPSDTGQFPIALYIQNNLVSEIPFFEFRWGGTHVLIGTPGNTTTNAITWGSGLPASSTSYDFVVKYRLNDDGVNNGRVFLSMDGTEIVNSETEVNWFKTDQLHGDGTLKPLKGPDLVLYRSFYFNPPIDVDFTVTDILYQYKKA